MWGKTRVLLLLLGIILCALMAWTHLHRIDLEATTHILEAEKIRHDYVISHDFGLLKEKLIESHRDHWTYYGEIEREARWQFGIITFIAITMITVLAMEILANKRKKSLERRV